MTDIDENLQLIIDTIPALAWSARPDGRVEFLNQHYLDFIGLSTDRVVGWNWTSAVHPDDVAGLAAWERILASGAPGEAQARLRRHDGQYRWFLLRANPLRDGNGHVKWYGVNTDIEDRKRAEAELRRSYDSFAEAQRLSRTGSFTADIIVQEHVWSDELYRICEFDPGTKITTDWARQIIHPEDLPSFDAAFQRSLGGADFDLTFRIMTRSGKLKHLHSVAHVIDRVEGRPLFIGAIRDVTDSKIAEEALGKSEREFRLLVETIPALVWRGTPEGELDYLNQRAIAFLGRTTESLSGGRWLELVHPDHREATLQRWLHSATTETSYNDEYQLRRADGQYRWIQSIGEPFHDTEGRIANWYGLVIDVEDRKRAEAELKRAYDSFADAQGLSHTGSFITDLLGDDHNWSDEAFRIFEFDLGTKVSVQRIQDTIHPDDLPAFESVIARGMRGENVDFAFRIVTARGAVKHVRGVAHVAERVAGRPLFIGALQDVTESKVAEEALNKARSELAHVTRVTTVSALTASIAHEVNQPLAGIITNAGTCLRMLAADPPDIDGARETVRRTMRDGNRASEVIARLRALFTKKEFTLEPLDLNEATREVVALSLSELQRNRIAIQSEFADDLPMITGDRIQLQQVMLNLLRNASDAMDEVDDRPRHLVIKTARDGGDRVRVTVRDAGVGLDSESMKKLFDAFYTTKTDGMGIGLSVSRSIIERHHGRLWAESNDGSPGAAFSFSIPCAAEAGVKGRPR